MPYTHKPDIRYKSSIRHGVFQNIQKTIARMEQNNYSEVEIAQFILAELHRHGLTLAKYEDWRDGLGT